MILLDADGLVYTYGFMAQRKNTDGSIELMDFNLVKKLMLTKVETIAKRFNLDHKNTEQLQVFLAGQGNYRYKLATMQPYKGNRDPATRPVYYSRLMDVFVHHYDCVRSTYQEVDDCIGIAAYKHANPIICTLDKDLNMIEGVHYNWKKDLVFTIEETAAYRFFCNQLVIGDDSDHVPSVYRQLKLSDRPDIARRAFHSHYKKKTESMLSKCNTYEEMLRVVKLIYGMFNLPLKNIDEVGKLLWIRRKPDEIWSLDYNV